MFLRKVKVWFFLCLVLIPILSGLTQAEGVTFVDPTKLFSTKIPDFWVYQSHYSTDFITVFYGEGDYELLYFENLGLVLDNSVHELAKRSLDLYEKAGGLDKFEIKRPLAAIDVAEQSGLACLYTYEDSWGKKLWEYRVFVLLPDGSGFSAAFGSDGDVVAENPLIDDILGHWRWLF